MAPPTPWHEQDEFWEFTADIMFGARQREMAPEQVQQTIALAGIEAGARILDMPCGVGRHSLEFATRGFRVTGVDRTQRHLDEVTRLAREQGLDVEVVRDDMRTFARPGEFDAAINLYTSFGYFEDQEDDRRVVANFHRSLREGGVLVMEMGGKEVLARIFLERNWDEHEDGTLVLQEREVDRDWSWMRNRWIVVRDGERRDLRLDHRIYSAAELSALLLDCGFASVDVFGGLDGSPYDREARRLVVVARR